MARGFAVGADVLTRTSDGVDLRGIWDDFNASLTVWNRTRTALTALFTFPIIESFVLNEKGIGDLELEIASEFGVPVSGRAVPDYDRMGFPLEWYDSASRYTRKFLRDASESQVTAQHSAMLDADNRLLFRKIMTALASKNVAGSRPVNENGVTVYDLWDASTGEVPPAFAGRTFTDTHSHYLVSGAATVDGGDLRQLIDTIQEHGFGLRSSNEQIVLLVNPAEADAISTFRRDPLNVTQNPFDFIPSVSAPAYLTDVSIIGDKAPASYNSLDLIGSYGDAWIHKNWFIPAGYVLAVATSGPGSTRNPLAFREHPQTESRGTDHAARHQRPLPAAGLDLRARLRRRRAKPVCSRCHADQGLRELRQPGLGLTKQDIAGLSPLSTAMSSNRGVVASALAATPLPIHMRANDWRATPCHI